MAKRALRRMKLEDETTKLRKRLRIAITILDNIQREHLEMARNFRERLNRARRLLGRKPKVFKD